MNIFRICFIAAMLTVSGNAIAQELSSMGDAEFLSLLQSIKDGTYQSDAIPGSYGGCMGLALPNEIARRYHTMTGDDLALLQKLSDVPETEAQIYSPLRKFIIHYDTSSQSEHTPAMFDDHGDFILDSYHTYAEHIGEIFDSSYTYLVETLGYTAPPDPPYHVYIQNMVGGIYGQTGYFLPELNPGQIPTRWRAYVTLDNDFFGYFSEGLDGARITAAHEFHHVIQAGSYGIWGVSRWSYFYEMTSTYLENEVFPFVDDYYQFLLFHFHYPEYPFNRFVGPLVGYQKAIFLQMLAKKYSDDVLVETWERSKSVQPEYALDEALQTVGSSFAGEVCDFGQWCYYTDYRNWFGDPAQHFPDAGDFPVVNAVAMERLTGGELRYSGLLAATGSKYYTVFRGSDTVTVILTNTDVVALAEGTINERQADYTLVIRDDFPGAPFKELPNGWSYTVEGPAISTLCTKAVVNHAVVSVAQPALAVDLTLHPLYPNPVRPGGEVECAWEASERIPLNVALYDVQGHHIRTLFEGVAEPGRMQRPVVTAGLVPGQYFLRLRSGGRVLVSPFTVLQ